MAPTQTLTLRAYGRTVELTGSREALGLARARLTSSYRPASGRAEREWSVEPKDGRWATFAGGSALSSSADLKAAVEAMLSDLELWVAEYARRAVFIHAGCVVAGGRAILIPGRSHAGKTTLTAALVRAGALYYSDEYAVLDHQGLVRPYARPLSTRSGRGTPSVRVTASELGGRIGRGPSPVGLIATLRYSAAGWEVAASSGVAAGMSLLDNAVAAKSRPGACLRAIQRATEGALTVSGSRGEADEAASRLLDMVAE